MTQCQFQKPYKRLISSPVYIKCLHSMVPNIWCHPQTMFSGGFSGEGMTWYSGYSGSPVSFNPRTNWVDLKPDFDQGACINEGHPKLRKLVCLKMFCSAVYQQFMETFKGKIDENGEPSMFSDKNPNFRSNWQLKKWAFGLRKTPTSTPAERLFKTGKHGYGMVLGGAS